MNTLVKQVIIPKDHRLNLEWELPSDYPIGEALLTLTYEPAELRTEQAATLAALRGKYKGTIWMASDFDAPLEDFADYS